jgi:hypothetical protein
LERRLEKLIALHFPPENKQDKEKKREPSKESLEGRRRPGDGGTDRSRRASSFFDLDLKDLRKINIGIDAGGLLKEALGQGDRAGKGDLRGMLLCLAG